MSLAWLAWELPAELPASREDLMEMLRQILPYMLFVVLLTITIFRKELSTNDEYRSSPRRKGEKPAGAEDSSISRRALEELFELNSHGSRFKTLLNDIAVDINQGFSLPELKEHFFASLLEGYNAFEFKTLYKLSRRRDRDRDASHLNLKKHDDDDLLGKEKKKKNLDNMSNVVLANVMTYLTYKDICALGSCNVALARDTRSDYIWRKLWFQNFGDMWTQERIANIRKARHIEWDPCKHTDKDKSYRQLSGLSAKDKAESDWRPRQGWFMFFLEFDACWVDWLLAGFCTEDCCLVGIGGNLYDLTAFLPHHPGSMETLTEVCGGEATDHFVDMGHSSHAVGLAKKLMIYSPYSEADFPKPTPTRAPSLDLELDLGPRGMPSLTSPGGGGVDLSPSGLMNGEGESTPTLQSSPTHGARRKTRFSQNHLLYDRYHLPINAHRRNLITAFQQQIRREQRAMERNAYKWNLRYSTRQEGNGSDKRRSRSGDGGAPRTISEELDFDSFMGPDTLSGPLEPVSEEGRGAESPTGSGKKHQDPCCRRGLPHFGRARAVYDPLKQEYFVWWTCCSTVHSQT